MASLPAATPAPQQRANDRKLRSLTSTGVRRLLPYAVASRYLISQDSAADTAPARLPTPALDDGPHLSYAVQWFSFAVMAIAASYVIWRRAQRTEATEANAQSQ